MIVLTTRCVLISYAVFLCVVLFSAQSAYAQEVQTPEAPTITSSTFTDENAWYNNIDGLFTWELPSDVTAVAVEFATTTTHEPMFTYEPPIAGYTPKEEDVIEGTQYLVVQFRNQNGWGDISYRKFNFDQTPPANLLVDTRPDANGNATLFFNATDDKAGIAGYVLQIGDTRPVFVTETQASDGFSFSRAEQGVYPILVVAYDRAGNSYANRFPIFMFERVTPRSDLVLSTFTPVEFTAVMLGLLAFLLLWLFVSAIIRHAHKVRRLREETLEVQVQMSKIFSALRDEIYDQVQSLSKRKRLSKGEQQVVENLNRVLEVSETLIEKEVADVKKILK